MSKQVLVNLNLNGNQIENVALHNVSTLPASGVDGQVVFLTSDKNIYRWNGSAWVPNLVSVNGKTGTAGATGNAGVITLDKSDVGLGNVDNTSDEAKKTAFTGAIASGNTGFAVGGDVFTELGKKLNLAGGTMSGSIDMDGKGTVTGLTAPDDNTDAATKAYVDAVDSKIPQAGTATPLEDGTAAVGTSVKWAREDHVHPTDTSRQEKITATGILKGDELGGVTAATEGLGSDYYAAPEGGIPKTDLASGVQTSLDKADAALPKSGGTMTGSITMSNSATITGIPTPTNDSDAATKKYIDDAIGALPANTAPLMDGTAAIGTATKYARADHVHPVDTSRQAAITATGILKGTANGVEAAVEGVDYGKYSKPTGGIPKADLAQAVQDSLTAADAALPCAGGAMGGDIAMGTHAITGLADPTNAQDAATKNYVDTKVSGLGVVLNFKGTKTSKSQLPTEGNKKGDVWLIGGDGATESEIGDEYVWVLEDGSAPAGKTGWEKLGSNVDMSKYATLESPAFTGTPTATTAAAGTNTTQIATTAFVKTAIDNISGVIDTNTGTINANETSVTVAYVGTLVNAYATMGGEEVILTKSVGSSAVTFTIAKAVNSAITCVVVSTKA